MQVARSAIGKVGMCPTCGRKMRISDGNTQPLAGGTVHGAAGRRRPFWRNAKWGRQDPVAREEAKRLFGRAADLFCNGQYGEALALFDELVVRFPGNPDIENAREQCLQARTRKPLGLPRPGVTSPIGIATDRQGLRRAVMDKLIDKLQHGSTDMVQLQAAELIARMEGFLDKDRAHASRVEDSHASESRKKSEGEAPDPDTGAEEEEQEAPETTPQEGPSSPPPFNPADFEAEFSSESTL